jgi:hypothetical protein
MSPWSHTSRRYWPCCRMPRPTGRSMTTSRRSCTSGGGGRRSHCSRLGSMGITGHGDRAARPRHGIPAWPAAGPDDPGERQLGIHDDLRSPVLHRLLGPTWTRSPANQVRIALGYGASTLDPVAIQMSKVTAARTGAECVRLPGGHTVPMDSPGPFAGTCAPCSGGSNRHTAGGLGRQQAAVARPAPGGAMPARKRGGTRPGTAAQPPQRRQPDRASADQLAWAHSMHLTPICTPLPMNAEGSRPRRLGGSCACGVAQPATSVT